MRKLIVILALLLTYTNSYTQDREQMRQMVSEYMKKIGIEDDQIQNSMMLVRKVMMEYVNEMEISEESIKKAIQDIESNIGIITSLINNAYPRNKNYGKDLFLSLIHI